MEEESGNYIYILFICIGVALLSVGVFYYFTDDKIKLEEFDLSTNKQPEVKDEEKTTEVKEVEYSVDEITLTLNQEKSINLSDKDIKLLLKENKDDIELLFNDTSIVSQKKTGSIKTYNSSEYLFVSSSTGEKRHTNFYIFDATGNEIMNYHLDSNDSGLALYQEYVDGKLKIYGTRLSNDNLVYQSEETEGVNICDIDKLTEKNIQNTLVVNAEYELKYYSDKQFKLTQIEDKKQTLIELQQEFCQGSSKES